MSSEENNTRNNSTYSQAPTGKPKSLKELAQEGRVRVLQKSPLYSEYTSAGYNENVEGWKPETTAEESESRKPGTKSDG
ncbi:hypothetical protein CI109_102487 [Kwoniella shandongensis]|uniref:Uncharacterized protein n=1 Tax=Kwoniella shandongensis TaxID=1734106 RepID=A0A5M6BZK3_9TREE|nr:uncharacterized protein CI109_003195 [Kwoniella shandongensis]KAA5528297.1 hypothetical protein CI109_003195 [Kwoniella shandongensis]